MPIDTAHFLLYDKFAVLLLCQKDKFEWDYAYFIISYLIFGVIIAGN